MLASFSLLAYVDWEFFPARHFHGPLWGVLVLALFGILLGWLIWAIAVGFHHEERRAEAPVAHNYPSAPSSGGLPSIGAAAAPATDGPGTFYVVGVDKTSGSDTQITIEAATAANARVKAELKGIVVTEVKRMVKQN